MQIKWSKYLFCGSDVHGTRICTLWSAAGRHGLAEAAEEGFLPLAHQLEVQRLPAEVTLGG